MDEKYNIFVRKPEAKRLLRIPRYRLQDDKIRMDLREIGWEGMDWIHLAQDRNWCRALVNAVMYLWIP
jgi:hypothetical protein